MESGTAQLSTGWYTEPSSGRQRYWDGSARGPYAATPPAAKPDGKRVQVAGYICAGLSALMPAIGLAGLILGIITATKRGRGGHGAAIIILSIVVGTIAAIVWLNVYLHHAAASTGSCYIDTSGNYICP